MANPRSGLLLCAALACGGLLMACAGEGDDGGGGEVGLDGEAAADAELGGGVAMGAALAREADAELRGQPRDLRAARLGGILLALDDGEVRQAQLELELGRDAVALQYATLMRDEHAAHAGELRTMISYQRVPPLESAIAGTVRAEAAAAIAQIERTVPGDVDFVYLRAQVRMHAAAAVLVARLVELVPEDDPDLRLFFVATQDAIADHRREAVTLLRAR